MKTGLKKSKPQFLIQKRKLNLAEPIILGIDEVGRGPWAGPLVVGAVILGEKFTAEQLPEQSFELQDFWQSLTDSKKLTEKKRTALNEIILAEAAATGLGWVSASELDQHGLGPSLRLATRRAVKQVLATKTPFTEIIIDGTINFLNGTPLENRVTLLKKADFLIKEVSAASIIAKVARDNYMKELSEKYPAYGFEKHVGYGTAAHKAALEQFSVCSEHRQSFKPIQKILQTQSIESKKSSNSSTASGQHAEQIVANYLEANGHKIVAHNCKTKTYEIDLISTKDQRIYFTEVKYRQNASHGSGLEQITATKIARMRYAANKYLTTHSEFQALQPLLAAASVEGKDYRIVDWLILPE